MRKYFSASRTLDFVGIVLPILSLMVRFSIPMLIFLIVGIINLIIATVIYCREKDVVDERNRQAITQGYVFGFTCMVMAVGILFLLNSELIGSPISKISTNVILIGVWGVGALSRTIAEFYYRYIE